jgi:predicted HAD superfamily Cof-like phosphohydrolase
VKRALEQVAAFNRMVGAPQGDVRKPDATVDMELRLRLIAEEFDELLAALCPTMLGAGWYMRTALTDWLAATAQLRMSVDNVPYLPEVADALADLAFVTIGANDVWGIPGDAVWEEVCRANMAKLGGPKDPVSGKALKPAGWTPPDIEGVLRRAAEDAVRREIRVMLAEESPTRCASASDGDCVHRHCPQLRDGEPRRSGRSCPLFDWGGDE